MKIFNNFDTNLKKNEYNEAVNIYWDCNVLLVQRYITFWIFKWLLWLFFVIIINVLIIWGLYWGIENFSLRNIFLWVLIILDLIYLYKLLNLYIDYKFDFTLVTPKWIITFKQKWIFDSKLKELPASQVRSVQSYRKWLIWNILSYWSIEIITDWWLGSDNNDGSSQAGKTKLTYVRHPNAIRKKIFNIINIDSDSRNICNP